jgi:hypothetical protein
MNNITSKPRTQASGPFGRPEQKMSTNNDDRWIITYWDGSRWVKVMSRTQFWKAREFTKAEADSFVELYGPNFDGKMKALRARDFAPAMVE